MTALALASCTSTSPPVTPRGEAPAAHDGSGVPAPAGWTGLTVGEVLAQCGTPVAEMGMRDEPPGKLRGVEFICHRRDPATRVVLEFEYHAALFSAERSWASELVKEQRLIRVGE